MLPCPARAMATGKGNGSKGDGNFATGTHNSLSPTLKIPRDV